MSKPEQQLKEIVRDLLGKGQVDLVVGFERGSLPLRSRPCVIHDADDADRLVWNRFCRGNLAVYLPKLSKPKGKDAPPPKIAIVAKNCDLRSVMVQVSEHQLQRENITIIGMPCAGQLDPAKIKKAAGDDIAECTRACEDSIDLVTAAGKEVQLDTEDVLTQACSECRFPAPATECADILVEGFSRKPSKDDYSAIKAFQALPAEERRARLAAELAKCIRCDACREACPNCYCTSCFADQTKPNWIAPGNAAKDVLLFHMARIFHQAGRCVECDACVNACPMGVDLRLFTRQLVMDAEDLYGCVPGLTPGELPALCVFSDDDSESFITES